MQCLKCGTAMQFRTVEGVSLWACLKCKGFWSDRANLMALTGRFPFLDLLNYKSKPAAPSRTCASCGRKSSPIAVSVAGQTMELDRCEGCGSVFFDKNELEKVKELSDLAVNSRGPGLAAKAPAKPIPAKVGAKPVPKFIPSNGAIRPAQRVFFMRVYLWMFAGLLLSGLTAAVVAFSPGLARGILGNPPVFYFLLLVELGLVFLLSLGLKQLSVEAAVLLFFLYCFTSGLTLSVIFFVYALSSIVTLFFVTAAIFGLLSVFGYYTDYDLTGVGHVLLFGLLGIILVSIVNLFLRSGPVDFMVAVVGVFIFTGLIAYDTQKLKALEEAAVDGSPEEEKAAVIGALELYLDFVNLLLKLLRIFGKRRLR